MRIELLPKMHLSDSLPSFYDRESATTIEATGKMLAKVNELIGDYNQFAESVNEKISEFINGTEEGADLFHMGIRQEFQDFINIIDIKYRSQNNILGSKVNEISEILASSMIDEKILFVNGTIDNNGSIVPNVSERLYSPFIKIEENARYDVKISNDCLVEFYFYGEDLSFYRYTDWNPSYFETGSSYKYMRILVKKSDNTPLDPSDYSKADWINVDLVKRNSKVIDLQSLVWNNQVISDNGEISNASTRFSSQIIPITEKDLVLKIEKTGEDDLWYQIHFFHEDGSGSVANYYIGASRRYPIPSDCNGIRLQFRRSDNGNMPLLDAFISALSIYGCEIEKDENDLHTKEKHPLSIGCMNVRGFNTTGAVKGCANEKIEENLPKWKKLFNEYLNTDLLMINEWYEYFDQAATINSYESLLMPFFPYHYHTGNGNAIFSKYPCHLSEIFINQKMSVCTFNIKGESFAFVTWLQANSYTVDTREKAYFDIIRFLDRYDHAIIAGDFNNDPGAGELSVLTDHGYILGNNGFWGQIDTCTTSTNPSFAAIDNIVAKNFVYEKFEMISEAISSDHFPIRASLSFFK